MGATPRGVEEGRRALSDLETRSCAKGVSFFVACLNGDAFAETAFETYFDRVFGYLILAETLLHSNGRSAALTAALKALESADLSSQLYLRMLTRIVVAELEEDPAERVAQVTRLNEYFVDGSVRSEISDWAARNIGGNGPISSIARRFRANPRAAVHVWLTCGLVTVGEAEIAMTPRERELLCYLAAKRTPVSRDTILEDVFGDDSPPKRAQLKVYVSRLRKLLGEDVISTKGVGYCLGDRVIIDVDWIARTLRQPSRSSHGRLENARALIDRAGRGHLESWPWYVAVEELASKQEMEMRQYLFLRQ
jgi:DNA-binding winged helix-turn-helix (wHTH) protein